MFNKILVAVDESEQSQHAVEVAAEVAQSSKGSLCLLHAFPHIADHLGSPHYDELVQAALHRGEDLLATYRAALDPAIRCDTQILEGPAAQAIVRVAKTENYDLIVMGTRGHTGVLNVLLGSVSNEVSHQAPCPVMIVH